MAAVETWIGLVLLVAIPLTVNLHASRPSCLFGSAALCFGGLAIARGMDQIPVRV